MFTARYQAVSTIFPSTGWSTTIRWLPVQCINTRINIRYTLSVKESFKIRNLFEKFWLNFRRRTFFLFFFAIKLDFFNKDFKRNWSVVRMNLLWIKVIVIVTKLKLQHLIWILILNLTSDNKLATKLKKLQEIPRRES